MTWWEYVERHTESNVQTVIADVMGVDQTAVSRWIRRQDAPAPATAIKIARHLGVAPSEVLLAAGHITAEEAQAFVSHVVIEEPTDEDLIDLLRERLRKAGEGHDRPAATKSARGDLADAIIELDAVADEEPHPAVGDQSRGKPRRPKRPTG